MIGRIVWWIVLVLVALGTTGFQLDRQSRVSPELASFVPEPFRAFGQAHIASSALTQRDAEGALDAAKKLVRRRPLPAENLRLLSAAQFKAGLHQQSAVTMQYAARRGWRDPIPQEAMMRFALAAGDEGEATRRFVALMIRPSTSDETLTELGEALFGAKPSEGQRVLTELLAGTEKWNAIFVRRGLNALPTATYVEALIDAEKNGAVFDCGQMRMSLKAIERRDNQAIPAEALQNLIENRCR